MSDKTGGVKTIVIAAGIGFAVAMAVMAVAIYFGYTDAYASEVDSMQVKLLGLPIYDLLKTGDSYAGSSVGQNMGIVCLIFIAIAICVERIIVRIKARRTNQ